MNRKIKLMEMICLKIKKILETKRLVNRLLLLFIIVMVLITIISNNINRILLPQVEIDLLGKGILVKEIYEEGEVEAKETEYIYVDPGIRILQVNVRAGERVRKGESLLLLDIKDLENNLYLETLKYKENMILLNKIKTSTVDDFSYEMSRRIETLEDSLAEEKKNLVLVQERIKAGNETEQKAREIEKKIKTLSGGLEIEKQKLQRAILLLEKEQEINRMEVDVKEYELKLQEAKIAAVNRSIQSGGQVAAPFDGITGKINVSRGLRIDTPTIALAIVNPAAGFQFKFLLVVQKAAYLSIDDHAQITLKSLSSQAIDGRVTAILESVEFKGTKKAVLVDIDADSLSGDETGEVFIKKESRLYEYILPNSSLGEDIQGDFIFILQEKRKFLGTEFYAKKLYIKILDSDFYKSAVSGNLTTDDNVIIKTNKILTDNCRVNLW